MAASATNSSGSVGSGTRFGPPTEKLVVIPRPGGIVRIDRNSFAERRRGVRAVGHWKSSSTSACSSGEKLRPWMNARTAFARMPSFTKPPSSVRSGALCSRGGGRRPASDRRTRAILTIPARCPPHSEKGIENIDDPVLAQRDLLLLPTRVLDDRDEGPDHAFALVVGEPVEAEIGQLGFGVPAQRRARSPGSSSVRKKRPGSSTNDRGVSGCPSSPSWKLNSMLLPPATSALARTWLFVSSRVGETSEPVPKPATWPPSRITTRPTDRAASTPPSR